MVLLAPYANDHWHPNGPGDARPNALKVIRDQGLDDGLVGKVFFITGCTSGLGLQTARAIHATGADIYFTGRDEKKGAEVREDLLRDGRSGKAEYIEMHLDSLDSVRTAAKGFLQRCSTLNVLICNAGSFVYSHQLLHILKSVEFNSNPIFCIRRSRLSQGEDERWIRAALWNQSLGPLCAIPRTQSSFDQFVHAAIPLSCHLAIRIRTSTVRYPI